MGVRVPNRRLAGGHHIMPRLVVRWYLLVRRSRRHLRKLAVFDAEHRANQRIQGQWLGLELVLVALPDRQAGVTTGTQSPRLVDRDQDVRVE
jgi:hypothetical protein